jgi:hypothetical protein
MLPYDSGELESGGRTVRGIVTSSLLESLVTWKLGRRVRAGAIGKVPHDGNSLVAYRIPKPHNAGVITLTISSAYRFS